MRAHAPLRISGLLVSALVAAAVLPVGCGPEALDPIRGIPDRSPVPVPSSTPITTRPAVVELIDMRGDAIAAAHVVSTFGDTILQVAQTDDQGLATLNVADGGQVTATRSGSTVWMSLTVDVPDGPLVKMRAVLDQSTRVPLPVEVHGAAAGESVHLYTADSGIYVHTAQGGPITRDLFASRWAFQNDGRVIAGAYVGTLGNTTRWGAAVDVAPGQTASVVLRSVNDSPVLMADYQNAGACGNLYASAVYSRGDALLWPGAHVFQASGPTIPLQPWGEDLANSVETAAGCVLTSGGNMATVRHRLVPDPNPVLDLSLRLPSVVNLETNRSEDGRPMLTWRTDGSGTPDAIVGLAGWWPEPDGRMRIWQFTIRPRAPGQHALVHPPLPPVLADFFGTSLIRGTLSYVDADHVDGYPESWRLHGRPRPGAMDVQYTFDTTETLYPLPF